MIEDNSTMDETVQFLSVSGISDSVSHAANYEYFLVCVLGALAVLNDSSQ